MDSQIESDCIDTKGLENQLVNYVAISSEWKVHASWAFKRPSHINLLELRPLLRLVSDLVKQRKSVRFVALVDSLVTRGAFGKGRSSSYAVASILRQISALMIAGGLYGVTPFAPTRLNVADDPTRDRPPRPPCVGLGSRSWPRSRLFALARLPHLRRRCANWVRLVLFFVDPEKFLPFDRSNRSLRLVLTRLWVSLARGLPISVDFALYSVALLSCLLAFCPLFVRGPRVVPVVLLLVCLSLSSPVPVVAMAQSLALGTMLTDNVLPPGFLRDHCRLDDKCCL